jgi:hypothetical protein
MRIEEGDTLTLEIPLRGQIQVRVGEVMDRRITLLTVAGHPIAGAVRFLVEERERDVVRFEIQVYDRPSSTIDRLLMRTAGEWLQRQAWIALARNVANDAGGTASEVQMLEDDLDAHDLAVVDDWARELNAQLSRNETSGGRL